MLKSKDIIVENQLFELDLDLDLDNVEKRIIKERNNEIKNLEKDLIDLHDSMTILSTMLNEQGEELNIAEINVENTVITTNEAVIILENIPDKQTTLVKNLKIVGAATVGGVLLGGIGSIFGIIPALIGVGVGTSGGGIVGYISNLFKK